MSDATQHTPGPWFIDKATTPRWIIIRHKSPTCGAYVPIATVAMHMEQEANAALITRAPDLLAQLAQVTAERDAWRADRDWVVKLLSRYGHHDNDCPLHHEANLPGDSRCTCGFSASLA